MTNDQTPAAPLSPEAEWRAEIERRVDQAVAASEAHAKAAAERIGSMEQVLTTNTEMTAFIKDVMITAKAGLSVLGTIGKLTRWAAKLATWIAPIIALYQMVKHGGSGQPSDK